MLRLIAKFMTAQTGQQIITILMLPNLSKNKDNRTMKFGQSKKYNIRNIFLRKSYRKNNAG